MEQADPRQETITGVARALIVTLGVDEAVPILVTQFGFDLTFLALAHVEGEAGCRSLWLAIEHQAFGH